MRHTSRTDAGERRPRILLVEDSFLVGEALRQMVVGFDYDVCGPFATCEDAEQALNEGSLDAAVLDIELRGGTSLPVAEKLLAMSVPVLFVTCYGELLELPPALTDVPRLVKPVLRTELHEALLALLEPA